jgi:serine/threonine protein kinase
MESSEEQVLAGRYVLGAMLGQGGMGIVRKALDLKLRREVAVKLLSSPSLNAEAVRRFRDEALAAGSLQHANVVQVFDAGEENGRPFLVTELLQGETLRQRLKRGPVPLEQAQTWARQLLAGLAAAHEKGLIHRDLKPGNLFITKDGWLKILDFGLATLTESDAGRVVGTIGYMAPEQVRGLPVDQRADLFNFGLVLYEMLTGKRAFADISATETSYAIVVRETEPLPATVPLAPRRLVARCLEKDREQRPASAKEILRLLQARAPSKRRWLPALVLLLIPLAILSRKYVVDSPPPPGSVAILPFDAREAPRLAALADGLSDLLAFDLKETPLRSIDPDTVRHAIKRADTGNVERSRAAGLQVGAKYFVAGRVQDRGGELSIEATLRDAQSSAPLATAAVQGKPEELYRLVRRLSDRLQKTPLRPAEFEARLTRLQEWLTPSFPALQAFLEAMYFWRTSNDDCFAAMRKASNLDPDFALAAYQMGIIFKGREPDASAEAMARALRHPDRLTDAQRTRAQLYVLRLRGDMEEAERVLRAATHDHPDDPKNWGSLAVQQLNYGAIHGHPPYDAQPALQKVLELDPLNPAAMGYLLDLEEMRGEREVVSKMADQLLAHSDSTEDRVNFQLARSWGRGDAAERAEAMKEVRAPGASLSLVSGAMGRVVSQLDDSPELEQIAAIMPFKPDPQMFVAAVHLFRGHVKTARRDLARSVAAFPQSDNPYFLPWIDSLEFLEVSPAQLAISRAAAARLEVAADRAPAKQYLIGLLALRAHDLKAAGSAAVSLAALPEIPHSSIAGDLALAMRARLQAAKGDTAAALLTMDKRSLRVPERYAELYNTGHENFFKASLLVALGRPREALPLYESLYYFLTDNAFYPAGHLQTARIYDSLGETENAIRDYERFVLMWKECDPELRPEVDRAQARLSRLRGR